MEKLRVLEDLHAEKGCPKEKRQHQVAHQLLLFAVRDRGQAQHDGRAADDQDEDVLIAVMGMLRISLASAGLRVLDLQKRGDQRREEHDLGGQEDPHAQLAIVQTGAGVRGVDEFAHDDLWCWKLEAGSYRYSDDPLE